MNIKIEFKPQDLWVGYYWKKWPEWKIVWHGTLKVKLDLFTWNLATGKLKMR